MLRTFRWVQVLRKNAKLTEEEREELRYCSPSRKPTTTREFADELDQRRPTSRAGTNNEITKETREAVYPHRGPARLDARAVPHRPQRGLLRSRRRHRLRGQDRLLHEKLAMSARCDLPIPLPFPVRADRQRAAGLRSRRGQGRRLRMDRWHPVTPIGGTEPPIPMTCGKSGSDGSGHRLRAMFKPTRFIQTVMIQNPALPRGYRKPWPTKITRR